MKPQQQTIRREKRISELENKLEEMDSSVKVYSYRTFQPSLKNIYFWAAHGNLLKIDLILENTVNLNKYKKIEITLCTLYENHELKLDINNNRTTNDKARY